MTGLAWKVILSLAMLSSRFAPSRPDAKDDVGHVTGSSVVVTSSVSFEPAISLRL